MSEDWRIPVDMIGSAIKSIAKDGFSVEVRPGLEVDTAFGETVILADGKRYGKEDIPQEIETELIEAANRHRDSIRKVRNI